MKVKVRTEFKDKYTGKMHKVGDELEMTLERINEVLKVGSFIELVAESKKAGQDEMEQAEDSEADQKEADGEGTSKTTGRRKRTSK